MDNLVVFKGKNIRRTLHNNEWWFAIVDIVAVLTDSANPSGYLKDMRRRDEVLSKGWGQIAAPLSVETSGGKQKINCANAKVPGYHLGWVARHFFSVDTL